MLSSVKDVDSEASNGAMTCQLLRYVLVCSLCISMKMGKHSPADGLSKFASPAVTAGKDKRFIGTVSVT